MPVPPPLLDSRTLQDILAQLREAAAVDVPEWTPPPEGDAGTMLQRIFARLLELALQRLNQVPEKNLLAFLDTMGVSLLPPSAAHSTTDVCVDTRQSADLRPEGHASRNAAKWGATRRHLRNRRRLHHHSGTARHGLHDGPEVGPIRRPDFAALNGQSPIGFTPFVGTKRMPHVLYLGDNELLNFVRATVDLDFQWEPATIPLADVRTFLEQLTWQYTQNGQLKILTPSIPDTSSPLLRFLDVESIAQTVVQGISEAPDIRQGKQSRWLQAVLTTPFPDDLVAQALKGCS